MEHLIENVKIFTNGQLVDGTLVVENGFIKEIRPASGLCTELLLPGCIDAHVHFREPGLTLKADIASESKAAAAGGVTTVLDMPNVSPTTTSLEALTQKHALFKEKSVVDYGLWYGITSSNIDEALTLFGKADSPYRNQICGFKVFLGSSTGGMLMNDKEKLRQLFAGTDRVIGIHSESEDIIRRNREKYLALYGKNDDVPVEFHPKIRDVEACMQTTKLAVEIALETGANLHVCHLTTQEELEYLCSHATEKITSEVCVAHLWFSQEDYKQLGTRIKCNPAVKRIQDRNALRSALGNGTIFSVATDHAPHLLSDKQGGALKAASGMPSVQYSLLCMLELQKQGILNLAQLVALMSTHPAQRFGYTDRGEIAIGKRADLVRINPEQTTHATSTDVLSKCGWTPFEGTIFSNKITGTWVAGKKVY